MAQALPGAQARTVSGLRSYGDGARDVGYVSLTEVADPGCQGEATSAGQGVVEATAEGGIPSGSECTSRSSSAALGGVLVGDAGRAACPHRAVRRAAAGSSGRPGARRCGGAGLGLRATTARPRSSWSPEAAARRRTGTCGCPPSPFPLRCCRPGCSRRRRLPAWACPCRRSPWSPPRSSPSRPGRRTGCATCCARWTSTERWWSSAVTSSGFGFGLLALLHRERGHRARRLGDRDRPRGGRRSGRPGDPGSSWSEPAHPPQPGRVPVRRHRRARHRCSG